MREAEDRSAFTELQARVKATLQPTDLIEEVLGLEMAGRTWNALRWRSMIPQLLVAQRHIGLERELEPILGPDDARDMARLWRTNDQKTRDYVAKLISAGNLSEAAIDVQTFLHCLPAIERIQHLSDAERAGCERLAQEVDRRRAARAGRQPPRDPPRSAEGESDD